MPWKTVKELVEYTRANPGQVKYAYTTAGGLPHLAGELFMLRTGTKMTGISHRGGGQSVTAVLSQAADLTFEGVAVLVSQIRDGKLRALAVQNATRSQLLPELPTMAEAGVPDAEASAFYGLVAPAGTPTAIIKQINSAMNEGMQTAEVQALLAGLGSKFKPNSPVEFASYIAAQNKKWIEVGRAAKVKIN